MKVPKVFISYSHDSKAHREVVLQLAQDLRAYKIDAWIDRFEPAPPQGWARWMRDRISTSDFVIMICTETYMNRFYGHEQAHVGAGATWEGLIISAELYQAHAKTTRFVPVILNQIDKQWIPDVLSTHTYYLLRSDFTGLYRLLTGQPEVLPVRLGGEQEKGAEASLCWINQPGDLQDVEIGAWFDGIVYHCGIVMTRANAKQPWTMEVISSLILHQDLNKIPKGMALVNLVNDSQHVGALMALEELQVIYLIENGTKVGKGQLVAVVRGPTDKQLAIWNPIKDTVAPYLQHSPPLGYRVWTKWRGTPESCIRIQSAKLIREGKPTRLAVCLKPMRVPPGLVEIRSPISGNVTLAKLSSKHFRKGQHLATVTSQNLEIDLTCDFQGRFWEHRCQTGALIDAGQVILIVASGLVEVSSPIVGTFYRCETPVSPPFVEIGDEVSPGDVVGIVEAMKMMNKIYAEVPGRVVEIPVVNGCGVEFAQTLIKIDCS